MLFFLFEEFEKIEKIKWIRFLYFYFEDVDENFIEVVKFFFKIVNYFDILI